MADGTEPRLKRAHDLRTVPGGDLVFHSKGVYEWKIRSRKTRMVERLGQVVILAVAVAGLAKCGTLRAKEPPAPSAAVTPGEDAASADITADVEVLGEPFKARWFGKWTYARNIWDMQLHGGRIYLGCGNSSNEGPATNAGPVPVICLDPRRNAFACGATLLEEQIDRYCVIDGRLYIPGHDPKWRS